MPALRAVVVVPARDEERRIAACLRALDRQVGLPAGAHEVIVVLDACRDATQQVVLELVPRLRTPIHVVVGPGDGVGSARRLGMDLACGRLESVGATGGLIAGTDADTVVHDDWLAAQLALVAGGAEAVGGHIELDPAEAAGVEPAALARRDARARVRLHSVRAMEPEAEHHFFSGASMALTARAYRRIGGIDPHPALEDEALARRLEARGVRVVRSAAVRVRTSARTRGRAPRGLARDLAAAEWLARRRSDGTRVREDDLLAAKRDTTISVILPARECAGTVAGVLEAAVLPFARSGLVDEVVVVDAGSRDGTAGRAAATGARVLQQDELMPEHGPALGKGDAMWRGVAATSGDVVAFLDADTADPRPAHLLGLLAPLLFDDDVALVKGAFARPFEADGVVRADEGGRVTELMARPLINLHRPELAGFAQPLAGETAARRGLLESIPFPTGYGVEIAMLMDAVERVGLLALAEAWLGARQNRHQPLRELGAMAYAVLCAAQRRIPGPEVAPGGLVQPWADGAIRDVPVLERPPLAELRGPRESALSPAGSVS